MADVWVSRKKWTCQYCNVTINDDVPSRQHHESGGRHKGNVERALQNLYKKGERERKDAQAAKREMDRIERLAAASYAQDLAIAAAAVPANSPSTADLPTKAPPLWKPKNKLTAYGSVVAVSPSQDITQTEPADPTPTAAAPGDWEEVRTAGPSSIILNATQPETERHKAQSFRIREKTGRMYDEDSAEEDARLAQIKVKKRSKTEDGHDQAQPLPTWSPVALTDKSQSTDRSGNPSSAVKAEQDGKTTIAAPAETDAVAATPLFKKRKSGSGAGAKKVRAIV